jgi:hypothetical protein
MSRISPVTETVIEAACKARHSPQKWGRTLKNTDMVGWINSQRAEMRMILTAAFDAAGHAQTPDLDAVVGRVMVIRNGMILDGDAEALIRKEIGGLMGGHAKRPAADIALFRDIDTAFQIVEREGVERIRNALADCPQRVRAILVSDTSTLGNSK